VCREGKRMAGNMCGLMRSGDWYSEIFLRPFDCGCLTVFVFVCW
jgi:hypothetical protein